MYIFSFIVSVRCLVYDSSIIFCNIYLGNEFCKDGALKSKFEEKISQTVPAKQKVRQPIIRRPVQKQVLKPQTLPTKQEVRQPIQKQVLKSQTLPTKQEVRQPVQKQALKPQTLPTKQEVRQPVQKQVLKPQTQPIEQEVKQSIINIPVQKQVLKAQIQPIEQETKQQIINRPAQKQVLKPAIKKIQTSEKPIEKPGRPDSFKNGAVIKQKSRYYTGTSVRIPRSYSECSPNTPEVETKNHNIDQKRVIRPDHYYYKYDKYRTYVYQPTGSQKTLLVGNIPQKNGETTVPTGKNLNTILQNDKHFRINVVSGRSSEGLPKKPRLSSRESPKLPSRKDVYERESERHETNIQDSIEDLIGYNVPVVGVKKGGGTEKEGGTEKYINAFILNQRHTMRGGDSESSIPESTSGWDEKSINEPATPQVVTPKEKPTEVFKKTPEEMPKEEPTEEFKRKQHDISMQIKEISLIKLKPAVKKENDRFEHPEEKKKQGSVEIEALLRVFNKMEPDEDDSDDEEEQNDEEEQDFKQ